MVNAGNAPDGAGPDGDGLTNLFEFSPDSTDLLPTPAATSGGLPGRESFLPAAAHKKARRAKAAGRRDFDGGGLDGQPCAAYQPTELRWPCLVIWVSSSQTARPSFTRVRLSWKV